MDGMDAARLPGAVRLPVRLRASRHALPALLPAGERVLWQGAPDWRALARNALHLRGLAAYFALLVGSVGLSAGLHGAAPAAVALDMARATLAACVPLGLGLAYAWLAARGSAYTITTRRVVIKLGIALPMTLNLPFAQIDGVSLSLRRDGTGDLALEPAAGAKGLSWMILWPHARPWRFTPAQPMMRGLHDAAEAGQILARAVASALAESEAPVSLASATGIVDTPECHHGETTVAA